jgi:hypothetical protein
MISPDWSGRLVSVAHERLYLRTPRPPGSPRSVTVTIMRRNIPLVLLCLVLGCSKTPLTVHDKPVSYWLDEAHDPDPASRKKAVTALGLAAAADHDAKSAVVDALNDSDASVRDTAVLALLNLGASASDAIADLKEMATNDPDPKVREHADRAVRRIESPN